uniref:L1 transposable element RRM domain-containing protein n=1 Tax=Esox lucius TaxID=8010 RepID=A0A3P8YG43_ESOLU
MGMEQNARATAGSKAAHASPVSPAHEDTDESISTAKIHELLQKLSDDQAKHFADIRKDVSETRRAVEAIEGKLADMLTRITSAEVRLEMLEEVERQRCVSPPVSALEVEKLNAKLTEYEDRERQVNLRIYGFPERVEDKDAISFLRVILPEILQADFEGGLDLERAHRSLLPAKPGAPPRPFIVQFLRFQQKERVRQLAREIGDVRWQNHKISFYQDFSKDTQERRHSAKIPFGIGYPAVLSFTTPGGIKHRFEDPKKPLQRFAWMGKTLRLFLPLMHLIALFFIY